jgi:malate dehydrogenase (oxaloacetate-decarboxylating)(NADP+)
MDRKFTPGQRFSSSEALSFHACGRPGKIEIIASKPMATQRDLSLAYSPGVAAPVLAIAGDPALVYDYTAKGNLVAVISNGTAILGLGNLGPLAAKPVMEGKAVLFKRFADVDSIDLELASEDPRAIIDAVSLLEPAFGGINLEDIKAPECFVIEQALREKMNIPVFHDDQHGTAIIATAGLLNALHLTNRSPVDIKLVINGAGAAAIACADLVKAMGVPPSQVILCDSKGVIYRGRSEGMNQWKSAHAVETGDRSLADAMRGADVFFGLSVKGAVTPEMVRSMSKDPIIFAMANPDPEILPEEIKAIRDDAIIATGRSDYPNQVNNVLGFPYIFRGALDVRATTINDAMKIAAAQALAALARQEVPDEVAAAYGGVRHRFGPEYIIPAPFDPRLIEMVPVAVAKAAMTSGVALKPIADEVAYRQTLRGRLNPTTSVLASAAAVTRANPKRVVFAEGEEEIVIRAASAYRDAGYGTPLLVGNEETIRGRMKGMGVDETGMEFHAGRQSPYAKQMLERLYLRLQRRGHLERDCLRMINQNRNIFGALLLDLGLADAMITGVTRHFRQSMLDVKLVIDSAEHKVAAGIHMIVGRSRTIFISDTTVHERPNAEILAAIASQTAKFALSMGHEPRVAFMSYSNFGNPHGQWLSGIREAISILDKRRVDFEYEGEMTPDVAMNPTMRRLYPFNRLSGPANVLIMPGLQSANISAKLMKEISGSAMIGPMLVGMAKPVQIAAMTANASDLTTLAMLAAAGMVN